MAELSGNAEEKIERLQLLEQNLQSFMLQKQNFQMQLVEVESALAELGTTDSAYKIVGNIMVASKKEKLKEELEEKKRMLELRINSLEKQEERLKEKAKQTQTEVLEEMHKKEH